MIMAATAASLNEVFPGIEVIDCDAHYTEPADLWTSRAPASLRSRMPQMRRVDDRDMWFVDNDIPLGPVGFSVIRKSGEKAIGELFLPQWELIHEASYDPSARLEVLNRLGIRAQILYPNVGGFGSSRFIQLEDEALRLACIQIYNDAVAELQSETDGRLLPQAVLPIWDSKALLKETERVTRELSLKGVTLPDTPERLGLPDFADAYWEPFWELTSELGLPINFHIGSADTTTFTSAPWKSMGPERRIAIGAALLYMDNARVIVNLLYSDIIDRHPNLKFVSVESGVGWIPFILEACEYQWDEMVPTECKHHTLRPREKFQQGIHACFWFEEEGPKRLIESIGADKILFETDFPHPTCLYPHSREHLQNVLADVSQDIRRKVLCGNAAKLYGIDL
jgi:predicted TIM-barrel fold metal-dependent hydrolase